MGYYELSVCEKHLVGLQVFGVPEVGRPLQAKTGITGMTDISVFVAGVGHGPGAVVDEKADGGPVG